MRFGRFEISLVPGSSWGQSLAKMLPRSVWNTIRSREVKRANYHCEVCGCEMNKGLHCHELWEYDEQSYVQRLVGYAVLCPQCHEVFHFGRANAIGRAEEALAWAAKVSGKDRVEIIRELDKVFDDWERRSAHFG